MKRLYVFMMVLWSMAFVGRSQTNPCPEGFFYYNGDPIDAVSLDYNSFTGLRFPFWMRSGETLKTGPRVKAINVIEFKEDTINGNKALEFSRVLSIDTNQLAVPAGMVWKVESLIKFSSGSTVNFVISGSRKVCTSSAISLSTNTTNGAVYRWSGPQNFTSTASSITLSNVTTQNQGVYTLTTTYNGCTFVDTQFVYVEAPPVASFTLNPATPTINLNTTLNPTNTSHSLYAWTISNNPAFQSGTNASSTSPIVQWANGGNTSVKLVVTTANGCKDSTSQSFTVITCLTGSRTFTTCGASGLTGPSQANCDAAYGSGVVTVNNGIQAWTVPPGVCQVTIEAWGAQGGNAGNGGAQGGLGGYARGTFNVTAGQVLQILVGQQGSPGNGGGNWWAAGGGGGTFVALGNSYTNATPWIVAGGGGGGAYQNTSWVGQAGGTVVTTSGTGTAGIGSANGGSGGAGFTSNAGSIAFSFLNGGNSTPTSYCSTCGGGGFGGGGRGGGNPGGGGGGYNGGNYGDQSSQPGSGSDRGGMGGTNFNAGSNPVNTAGQRSGNGQVIISW